MFEAWVAQPSQTGRRCWLPWPNARLAVQLRGAGLEAAAIERVLMVGGSTLNPWIRDAVQSELRCPVEHGIDPVTVVAEYRRLYPHYSPGDVFFAATTASRSWRAAVVEAELRSAQRAPTWAYQLDYPSPLDGGKWGAFHTHDIPLVFGTLSASGSSAADDAPTRRVSAAMSDSFIALARHGDPNHRGLPHWATYTLPSRTTMVFDREPRLVDDPRGDERRLFARVPFIQQGT